MRRICWRFIRHAPVLTPVDWNVGAILGRFDAPADLSDRDALARTAAAMPDDAVWLTSPLSRARATAAALSAPGAEIIVEPDLIEQDFGRWQGRTHGRIADEEPEEAAQFWRAPMRNPPPGGESFAAVVARTRAALDRLSSLFPGRDVVAVAHDGLIRAALCVALDCPPETVQAFRFDYLSCTRLDRFALNEDGDDGRSAAWRVEWVNRIA